MGGRSNKEAIVGWRYFFGILMGIGRGPVDAIREVRVGDRTAWTGNVENNGTINIAQPELFGGEEKEGGVEGPLEVMMGGPSQVASAGYQTMRGSDIPGLRRVVTLFFNGLIGMNNPYPKPWKFRINRILQGWDGPVFRPDLARIPMVGDSVGTTPKAAVRLPLQGDFTVFNSGAVSEVVVNAINTDFYSGNLHLTNSVPLAESFFELVFKTGPFTEFNTNNYEWTEVSVELVNFSFVPSYLSLVVFTPLAVTSGRRNSPSSYDRICFGYIEGVFQFYAEFFTDLVRVPLGNFSTAVFGLRFIGNSVQVLVNGAVAYTHNYSPTGSATSSLRYFAATNDLVEGGVNIVDFHLQEFRLSASPAIDASFYAMNPAHIIFECLTNREWGRGVDRSQLDQASFEEAALTLATESFGLCLKWTRTDEIDAFIQKVIDTIGGSLYVSRTTALLTLKLIRGGYKLEDLPLFTPETGLLEVRDATVGVIAKSVNSVTVIWHDPLLDEDRPVRVSNPASLLNAAGVANNTTNEYKGIPNSLLAARVAQRDLRAVSTNLRRLTAVFDRRAEGVEPGSVIAVEDLSRGIPKTAFRVGRVEDGTITDGRITLSLGQDVFALPEDAFVASVPSSWTPPDTTPCVPAQQRVIETPYFLLTRNMSRADLDYLTPESAFLGTLSARGKPLNIGHRIHVRSGGVESGDTSAGGDYACEV